MKATHLHLLAADYLVRHRADPMGPTVKRVRAARPSLCASQSIGTLN